MNENKIATIVVNESIKIHRSLGPGLLESVYETILADQLSKKNLEVLRQVPISIKYDGIVFNEGFRADLIIDDKLIIELKSVETLTGAHKKQLLTYLKLSDKKLGLLLNFNEELMKNGIVRIINGSPEP